MTPTHDSVFGSRELSTRNHRDRELAKTPILGDENFIVSVCEGGFLAWCFNKDIKVAGEDEDYARHRQNMLRKRLEQQRIRDAKAIAHISEQVGTVNSQELKRSLAPDRSIEGDGRLMCDHHVWRPDDNQRSLVRRESRFLL